MQNFNLNINARKYNNNNKKWHPIQLTHIFVLFMQFSHTLHLTTMVRPWKHQHNKNYFNRYHNNRILNINISPPFLVLLMHEITLYFSIYFPFPVLSKTWWEVEILFPVSTILRNKHNKNHVASQGNSNGSSKFVEICDNVL